MKRRIFTGLCTALVTPFSEDGIDFSVLEQLIKGQIEAGTEAIVLAGTTGESPTLTHDEKLAQFREGVRMAAGRCKVIAGAGSNSTKAAIDLSREAEDCGVDGLLVVTPYYNKATQPGLAKHYSAVCNAVSIPVIAYNVPSRTGVDISVDTCKSLAEIPNLAGIKEACGDISKVARILASTELAVWSGNDDQTVPVMALGGAGVISVASNVIPKQMHELTHAALEGDFAKAAALQRRFQKLMDLLFCQVNPIPVKAAMLMIGVDCGQCRMPLDELTGENARKLQSCLDELGISAYNR
jgi:4-hydroxy-tetrahydrodipicolinate synthase